MKLAALRKKMRNTSENTKIEQKRSEEKREKRLASKKKKEPVWSLTAVDIQKPKKRKTKPRKPKTNGVNSTDVERWFRGGVSKLYGEGFIIPAWTIKQRTLAKKLLTVYGEDLVKRSVVKMCSEWNQMVRQSRGNISGAPTINFLWGIRERIFADLQNANKPPVYVSTRDSDEYIEDKAAPKFGW